MESMAEGFELFCHPALEREAREAQEAAETLIAQANGVAHGA